MKKMLELYPTILSIGREMFTQDKRSTSHVYFVVVENKKIYGVDSDWANGRERRDMDSIDTKTNLCEDCQKLYEDEGELPDECENWECDDSFIHYAIEEHRPNLYAGIFFTAKACDEHIERCSHHYNGTARSYGMSAYHNEELKAVMDFICPKGGLR